ncbi:hypothetical protein B0T20DRAFT_470771 [Sordaria brevicollis]|uniref:Uncharacterized protein n=1 Tax=Sordaria brevicollis TaxID=83679 RepID=A0AAE0PCX1_SORBR|nr:hypothetical protein B0T20DRAFT_470771 [Sordaria brevicollis]
MALWWLKGLAALSAASVHPEMVVEEEGKMGWPMVYAVRKRKAGLPMNVQSTQSNNGGWRESSRVTGFRVGEQLEYNVGVGEKGDEKIVSGGKEPTMGGNHHVNDV